MSEDSFHGIRSISARAAATLGYVPITVEMDAVADREVMASMARSMEGVDVVWIDRSPGNRSGERLELARRRGELKGALP